MDRRSAAPGAGDSGAAGSSAGRAAIIHLPADLPPEILTRLAAEGVHTLTDWRALGHKRFRIFGITREVAARIDGARAVLAFREGTP